MPGKRPSRRLRRAYVRSSIDQRDDGKWEIRKREAQAQGIRFQRTRDEPLEANQRAWERLLEGVVWRKDARKVAGKTARKRR
jgi:hypothetical protein